MSSCRWGVIVAGGVWLAGAVLASALPAPKGTEAVFDITPAVVVTNPPRFGVDIEPPAMTHWNTEPWHNQWWLGPNPNPITARHKGVATGGSATTLDDDGREGKGAKISFYDVFRTGFFDGGTAAVYRYAEGRITLLREGRIARYEASLQGPNRITFAEPGPAVQAGDEYVLSTVRLDFPREVTRTWGDNPWWLDSALVLDAGREKELYGRGVRVALLPDAPPGGGGASFALTLPAGWSNGLVSVGYWLLSGQQADWPRLHEGKVYTLKVWLKQQGMASGRVEIRIASLTDTVVQATSEWREYTVEVMAKPPRGTGAERLEFATREAGRLLIDNITLVEKEGPPPYGFYPVVVETLRRFHPGTLRLWPLQENRGFGRSLGDALGNPAEANLTFQEVGGARTTVPVGLHQQLELCEQVGADPWIITSTLFSAAEQKNLIEYLAGPADSPYGAMRARWGHPGPWTERFGRIKIEMGNETWNSMFTPQNFTGRPAVYGAYSEFMFRQMMASPWYRPGKFEFVVNGFAGQTRNDRWGYGANALRSAPSAGAVDIAYYTGGWDAVGLLKADSPEEGWMNVLTYARRMLAPRSHEFKLTAEAIAAEQGRTGAVECLVYEAGPGYTLPGPGKLNRREQEEGKSLAQAVNALDIFMTNLREGYGLQAFFAFKNGHYWASHNRQWGEHIAWKALGMRNALLKGDLVTATASKMVTLDLPETKADVVSQSNSADKRVKSFPPLPNLPLVDCYPFKEGPRYSVMLVSRRLDGPTRVTLNMPVEMKPHGTLYRLAGDRPDLHNIDAEVVRVESEELNGVTRSLSLSIPPHSVLVFVGEAR